MAECSRCGEDVDLPCLTDADQAKCGPQALRVRPTEVLQLRPEVLARALTASVDHGELPKVDMAT